MAQEARQYRKGEIVGYVDVKPKPDPNYEPRCWYVLKTLPSMEVTATAGLIARDWRAYNPEIFKRETKGGKTVEKRLPMFPNYVFIKMTDGRDDFGGPRKIRGVAGFLDIDGSPAILADGVMPRIWAKEAMAKAFYYREIEPSPFKVGDVVKLPDSALPDELALIDQLDDSGRVTVLMNLLGGVRRVRTTVSKLAPV